MSAPEKPSEAAQALERARVVCPFESYHTPTTSDCGWCVDIAREIQRAAEEATAAERERAAKVAENADLLLTDVLPMTRAAEAGALLSGVRIAAAIRSGK